MEPCVAADTLMAACYEFKELCSDGEGAMEPCVTADTLMAATSAGSFVLTARELCSHVSLLTLSWLLRVQGALF